MKLTCSLQESPPGGTMSEHTEPAGAGAGAAAKVAAGDGTGTWSGGGGGGLVP